MAHSVSCFVVLGIIILEVSSLQLHPGYQNYLSPPFYPQNSYQPVYQPPQYAEPPPQYSEQPPRYADPPPQHYPPPVQAPTTLKVSTEAPKPLESSSSSAPIPSSIMQALKAPITNSTSGKIDPAVLSNLAVALQLLIVSNLLHGAKDEENSTLTENIETSTRPTVVPPSVPYSSLPMEQFARLSAPPHEHPNLPNQYTGPLPDAKFVGQSGFADSGSNIFSGPFVPPYVPRPGHSLKSPYDILASPPSPFDPYTPNYKVGFQSPYAAMMNPESSYANDLFSF